MNNKFTRLERTEKKKKRIDEVLNDESFFLIIQINYNTYYLHIHIVSNKK